MKKLFQNAIINNTKQHVLVENDTIIYIGTDTPSADKIIDLKGSHLIPGMIDPHVHVRDLGQTDKEDWCSASKAALKGGITTIFDMPNNKPPTINLKNLNLKRAVAQKSLVNYKFNIAVTGYNLDDVNEILLQRPSDVAALKLFLAGSSNNEYVESVDDIKRIFNLSLQYDIPVIIHTELQQCVEKYASKVKHPTINDHNFIRNRECANKGTELVINLAKNIGNAIYIAHTSTAEEVEMIRQNKNKARIYCEVSPHHLLLNEEILQKSGNYGKVNPPLRTAADNKALWEAIIDGTVDTIGTDHAPHKLVEKQQSYTQAPSGFPGLETALPLLLNEVRKGKIDLQRLIELTSTRAAEIFNLHNYGRIAVGYKADFAIFDLHKTATVKVASFETKAKYSPFEGMEIVPVKGITNIKKQCS